MQLIKLNIPFGEEPNDFYCPVTGKKILSTEDWDPSPATAGSWFSDVPSESEPDDKRLAAAWSEFRRHEDLAKVGVQDVVVQQTGHGLAAAKDAR